MQEVPPIVYMVRSGSRFQPVQYNPKNEFYIYLFLMQEVYREEDEVPTIVYIHTNVRFSFLY